MTEKRGTSDNALAKHLGVYFCLLSSSDMRRGQLIVLDSTVMPYRLEGSYLVEVVEGLTPGINPEQERFRYQTNHSDSELSFPITRNYDVG